MTDILLQFDDIAGGYGETEVVRGISGGISEGEVVAITGRNGVGKSTLLKLLFGLLTLTRGRVSFQRLDLVGVAPAHRSQKGISFCPQERIVFDNLSVWENLSLMLGNTRPDDFAAYFEHFPKLQERLRQHAGTLSGGERKMLSFVRAMAEDKPLVLFDEPTEGVQQENIDHMSQFVRAARGNRRSFIIVEQNIDFIKTVADYLIVLDQGVVVLEGPASAITRDEIVGRLRI